MEPARNHLADAMSTRYVGVVATNYRLWLVLFVTACGGSSSPADAGVDATTNDASQDAATEAASEAGQDAGADAATEASACGVCEAGLACCETSGKCYPPACGSCCQP